MRLLNIFLIIAALAVITSCYRKDAPESGFDESLIISKDTMEMVILDAHLIDGAYVLQQRQVIDEKELPDRYFQLLMDKYGISEDRFNESIRYYTYHVEEMDEIYENVINEMGKIESELNMEK
jgi:hypothetical protein